MKKYLCICFIVSILISSISCKQSETVSEEGDFKEYFSRYKQDDRMSKELTKKN